MKRKTLLLLLFICFIGFGLRLTPVRMDHHYWDETVYLQHGEIIAGESPNNYNEFDLRPPLFSLMLGGLFSFVHSTTAAHVFVALLSALGIPLIWLLGKDLFDPLTGMGAAAIYATSPLALELSHDILVDSILPVFWILTVYSLWHAIRKDSAKLFFVTGIMSGLAVLMKFTSMTLWGLIALAVVGKKYFDSELFQPEEIKSIVYNGALTVAGAFLAVLPYLAWSRITYGSFLYTIQVAWNRSGLTDPFLTYVMGLQIYILPVFLVGAVLYFYRKEWEYRHIYPLIFITGFVAVMQLVIGNKEHRFLMPVIPFVSLVAAEGFRKIDFDSGNYLVLLGVLAVISAPFVTEHMEEKSPLQTQVTLDQWHPPVEDASKWLKNNTDEDAVVYTNYQYPAIGYYSKREVVVVQSWKTIDEWVEEDMDRPGYIFYSENSPFQQPSLDQLRSDPRFELAKSFDSTVYLYYYGGESQ